MSRQWQIETPALPTSPRGDRRVGVVTVLRGQVESDRETALAAA